MGGLLLCLPLIQTLCSVKRHFAHQSSLYLYRAICLWLMSTMTRADREIIHGLQNSRSSVGGVQVSQTLRLHPKHCKCLCTKKNPKPTNRLPMDLAWASDVGHCRLPAPLITASTRTGVLLLHSPPWPRAGVQGKFLPKPAGPGWSYIPAH